MTTRITLCLALLILTAAAARADSPSVAKLGWLAGSWISTQTDDGIGEQTWLRPRAGTMLGVFRLSRRGKVEFTELLTVREADGGLVLTIRRLGGDLQPLPADKGGLAQYHATGQTATGTVFESKAARLSRVTWRTSSRGMEVQVIPTVGGKPVLFEYRKAP